MKALAENKGLPVGNARPTHALSDTRFCNPFQINTATPGIEVPLEP